MSKPYLPHWHLGGRGNPAVPSTSIKACLDALFGSGKSDV